MSTDTLPGRQPEGGIAPDSVALRYARRVRDLKAHAVAFVVGAIVLTAVWVLTEYLEAGGWPRRFGDGDAPGTWHLWIFYVLGLWALFVALRGVGTYFSRPSGAELSRTTGAADR